MSAGNSLLVSSDSDENWKNDSIQFPRLLAEIWAAGGPSDELLGLLAESMDLDTELIVSLFLRAVDAWDEIKRCTP